MNFIVKSLNVILSLIVLNGLMASEAQLFSGTSVVLGKKHYYIETANQGNFYEAAFNCAQMGMTLASIESKTEYISLKNVLTSAEIIDNDYWLSGLTFGSSDKKTFSWLGTGRRITYWSSSEIKDEDKCLQAVTSTFAFGAADCASQFYYICEKPLEPYCGKYGQCRYTYSYNSN